MRDHYTGSQTSNLSRFSFSSSITVTVRFRYSSLFPILFLSLLLNASSIRCLCISLPVLMHLPMLLYASSNCCLNASPRTVSRWDLLLRSDTAFPDRKHVGTIFYHPNTSLYQQRHYPVSQMLRAVRYPHGSSLIAA